MTKLLDQTDIGIISTLQEDGRATNKRIATIVGVTEATVAKRLKRLIADGVLYSTVQRDIFSLGYAFQAIIQLWTSGRKARDVARELGMKECISTVVMMSGSPEIVLFFNARSHAHAAEVVAKEVSTVRGVHRVEVSVTLSIYKSKASSGMIRNSTRAVSKAHKEELSRISSLTAG